jgi:hypothetical protein
MTISFFEPGDVPQPPEKTKIEHLSATPSDDGWRVKVEIHITPFQVRPSLELSLNKVRRDGPKQVASFSIVETMHHKMEFTMHVRGVHVTEGDYDLHTMLYYRDAPQEGQEELQPIKPQDEKSLSYTFPVPEEAAS